jgi:hypothetical protein
MIKTYTIYSAEAVSEILGKAYITIRNRLKAYAKGKKADFGGFIPEKFHDVWVFSTESEPVEPATEEDVLREKAKRKGLK